ncbi:MAG: hypothetical protein V1766_15830 [Pseudomonadota bacterium]
MQVKDIIIPIHDYLAPESNLKEAVNLFRTAVRGEQKLGGDYRFLANKGDLRGCCP